MQAPSPRTRRVAPGRLLALATILLLLLPLLAPLTPGEAAPLAAPAAPPAAAQAQASTVPPTAPDRARVEAGLRNSPVMFIENVGQFDERARFQVRGATGTMWLAEEAVWISVVERTPPTTPPRHGEGARRPFPQPLPEAGREVWPPLSLAGRGGWGVRVKLAAA